MMGETVNYENQSENVEGLKIAKYTDPALRELLYRARKKEADALAILEQQAHAGHIRAQRYLGLYWYRTTEPERAIPYWQAALPQGCHWSRYYYGKALYSGRGITQNRLWALRQWQILSGYPDRVARLARHALYRLDIHYRES